MGQRVTLVDLATFIFHAYGRDGVMGKLEPRKGTASRELGLAIEVAAFPIRYEEW